MSVSILGCGAWAMTIANLIALKNTPLSLWCHDEDIALSITKKNKHPLFEDFKINPKINATHDLEKACYKSDAIIIGVASPFISIIKTIPKENKAPFLLLSKGLLENSRYLLLSEYIEEQRPDNTLAILSGPNLASEINNKKPAATVIACKDNEIAIKFQNLLSNEDFRVYTSMDPKGVALGGILKNIMAIAGGCVDGLNLGMNSKAALLSRALQEMSRIGESLGGQKASFTGLSGLGDLIATANSPLSRNWKVGYALAKGENFENILKKTGSIAEGVKSCKLIYEHCQKHHLSAPITEQLYQILYQKKGPKSAINDLMNRELKAEES